MNSLKQRVKKNKVRNSRMNWHDPEEIRQCRKCHLEKPLKEFTRTYQMDMSSTRTIVKSAIISGLRNGEQEKRWQLKIK